MFEFHCERCGGSAFLVEVERDGVDERGVSKTKKWFRCVDCGHAHDEVDADIAFAADYGFFDEEETSNV